MRPRAQSKLRVSESHPFMRGWLAVLLAAMLGLTTGWSPAAVGADETIVVTTTSDTVDASTCDIGDLPGNDGVISLREAICAANNTAGADTITFNLPGSAPWTIAIAFPNYEFAITDSLTITGPGQDQLFIDGDVGDNPHSKVFTIDVDDGTVAISGVTITGGGVDDDGGGIYIDSGTVNISNAAITGNAIGEGYFGGGGIYNSYDGTLTLSNVTVSDNTANYGGGIANFGTLTVENSIFRGNASVYDGAGPGPILVGPLGGGLYNGGVAELTDTSFTENSAVAPLLAAFTGGGGIFSGELFEMNPEKLREQSSQLIAEELSLTLTRVTVSDNSATGGGGILLLQFMLIQQATSGATVAAIAGTATIDESTIANNTACTGGGLANLGTQLFVTNSTISGNQAMGDDQAPAAIAEQPLCGDQPRNGGGIASTPFLMINSTVSGNLAGDNGGGLYIIGGGEGTGSIDYSTITGNTAAINPHDDDPTGGGIYVQDIADEPAEELTIAGVPLTPAAILVFFNSTIVAGNNGPEGGQDCDGPLTSAGHNLVGEGTGCPSNGTDDLTTNNIAAVLNTNLAENGGPTRTHALVANSPAIDAGDGDYCVEIAQNRDQRGVTRPKSTQCDIGAYELDPAELVTLTVQVAGDGTVTASPVPTSSTGTPDNMVYSYPVGTVVTLTATPGSGQVFARWAIDGVGDLPYGKGWASPLTITLDANHTAEATFVPRPNFSDVSGGDSAFGPITELAARDIIKGYTAAGCAGQQPPVAAPCYGPGDLTERAQTAALLTRLLNLEGEDNGDGGFSDLDGLGPELRRAVGTMAHYGIMVGYEDGRFGPFDKISHLQTVLVISRAFVFQGYWTRATTDDSSVYPNLNLSPDERLDLVTFVQNAGMLPGFANDTQRAAVDQPAPRAWTARAFWLALNGYFGVDEPGKGGFVP